MIPVTEPSCPNNTLKKVLKTFKDDIKHPEIFLSNQPKKAEKFKILTKNLYDLSAILEDYIQHPNVLPELYLDHMDEEQIWQQLELRNKFIIPKFIAQASRLLSYKDGHLTNNLLINNNEEDDSPESEGIDENVEEEESECLFDEGTDDDIEPKLNIKQKSKKYKSSVVDDKFFKLGEMEEFLKAEDVNEENRRKHKISVDDGIDFFESGSDDEDEQNVKYSEFFDDEEEDELSAESLETNKRKESKKRRHSETNPEDEAETGEESDSEHNSSDETSNQVKSSYEERSERLKAHIEDHEKAALGEKPWQLKGEIFATGRPQNSLLEEILEFDSTTRPAPVITEETTLRLEDIIRQRIKDKAWDDVVRKHKPIQTPQELRKKLVLDQEKSKESLAQIYEKEYRNQIESLNTVEGDANEDEPKSHKEIKSLMKALFLKLDALSNFHYTPKLAVPEPRIITNTPAVEMEEIAPISVSNAKLLAPEEVKTHVRGDVIGKGEKTQTDKNRERRKKKLKQKILYKSREEKLDEKKKLGIITPKSKEQEKLLKNVIKHRNVEKLNTDGATVKSSKSFFSQMQDKVSTQQGPLTKKKNSKEHVSAKRLKL